MVFHARLLGLVGAVQGKSASKKEEGGQHCSVAGRIIRTGRTRKGTYGKSQVNTSVSKLQSPQNEFKLRG